jgi:hypothetical protein
MIAIICNRLNFKGIVNLMEVERQLPKLDVAVSIPVSRSIHPTTHGVGYRRRVFSCVQIPGRFR